MRMGIGLGVGINRSNYAQGIFNAYSARVVADGGVVESGTCVDAVSSLLQSGSLLLIPSGYKGGKLYSEIPTNGNGDLTWTRGSTAIRTNSSGLLESMATGVPRLSYMYGSCPSVLLEPQRTNLCLYSDQFNDGSWGKTSTSVTANTTTSPDGTSNADKLIINNAISIGVAYIQQAITKSASSLTYSYTCYAKQSELNAIRILVRDSISGANFAQVYYNINDGSVISAATSGGTFSAASSTITSGANGFYRINLTFTSSTDTQLQLRIYPYDTVKTTGNGTDGIFIYGAQLEAGAYPTTYIPTTSATATRVADSFSRSNIYTNGLISASGGTWFVELRGNVAYQRDANNGIWLGDSTSPNSGNQIMIRNGTTSGLARLSIIKYISGASTFLYSTTTDTVKIAINWNGSTADVFVNGTKQVSATAFTTTLMENLSGVGSSVPYFIQQMALSPEPLTDAKLIELTTL